MLIPFPEIVQKYGLKIKGIIQVGVHWAEEHETYVQLGVNKMVYIEPCSEAFKMLTGKFPGGNIGTTYYENIGGLEMYKTDQLICFKVACGEETKASKMYVSHNNQGQSNSLLKPLLHLTQHPEVIFTDMEDVIITPLDSLPFNRPNYNVLVMDTQGFEGQVLKGSTETLKHIDLIYTECNNGQTYEDNMELDEMDIFLSNFGFVRTDTYFPSPNWTWGDCIFIRKTLL